MLAVEGQKVKKLRQCQSVEMYRKTVRSGLGKKVIIIYPLNNAISSDYFHMDYISGSIKAAFVAIASLHVMSRTCQKVP